MYNSKSNPTITNSKFTSNWAKYGGGMHNRDGSSPTVKYSMYNKNSTAERGGGMDNYDSSPTLINCIFSKNMVDGDGGGMFDQSSSTILSNCTFNENDSSSNGGGMFNLYSKATLTDCKFRGNSSGNHGGGMFNGGGNPTLTNCTFSGNLANSGGGGMYNREGSPTLTNCIFSGNTAAKNGGGISNNNSPKLINCTFGSNSAELGGGLYNDNSSFDCKPTLTNCIFWDNRDNSKAANSAQIYGGAPIVTYNCVQDANPNDQNAYPGTGNIDDNPLFTKLGYWTDPNDPNATWIEGNYHLLPDSPCIDAGDPNSDYSLEPKPNGGRINIGAYGNTPEATSKGRAALQPYDPPNKSRHSTLLDYYTHIAAIVDRNTSLAALTSIFIFEPCTVI